VSELGEGAEPAACLDSVELRHDQIHEDHVGRFGEGDAATLLAVPGFQDAKPGLFQQVPQNLPEQSVVINDQGNRLHLEAALLLQ
jgi:hypothetical protein